MSYFNPIKPGHLAGLDHLRALAITMVFVYHYRLFDHPAWIDTLGSFGWTGVDLFFVLSGYLIASQIFEKVKQGNFHLKEFVLKRFFRIIPAYLAVVTLYFTIPYFREWEHLPPLWRFLTFTQNFGLDLRYTRTFSHAWSLCIEEQFYFFFPLAVLLFTYFKAGKKAVYLVAALFASGVLIRVICWNTFVAPFADNEAFVIYWYKYIYYPTYCRLDGLLAGVSIAGLSAFFPGFKKHTENKGNAILLAGLILIIAAYFLCTEPFAFNASVWGFPLIAIAFGCIVTASITTGCVLYRFTSIVSSYVARLSYALYLTHKAMIHICQDQLAKTGIEKESSTMFLLCIPASLLGAMMLFYVVEKPFLMLRNKVLRSNAISRL